MKRAPSRQHLVENRAERKNVGTMIYRFAAHLFGRHVANRTYDHAGICIDSASGNFTLRFIPIRLRQLRQSEVKNLYAAIFSYEDVVRFEVAMDDAFLVRSCKTLGNLACTINYATLGHRRSAYSLA